MHNRPQQQIVVALYLAVSQEDATGSTLHQIRPNLEIRYSLLMILDHLLQGNSGHIIT